MLQVDFLKKSHRRLIAAALDVLPHGLGNFRHVIEVDFQKAGYRCVNGCFARGSGNFKRDPSLGKFDVNWGNVLTSLGKSTSNNLAALSTTTESYQATCS